MVLKLGNFGKCTTNKIYLESFEMWCCRKMKICWTDRVRDEVLQSGTEKRNILITIKKRKANWIGHVLDTNCILKHIVEGKIDGRTDWKTRKKT